MYTVMVIDDSAVYRQLMSGLLNLSPIPCRVIEAVHGREALDQLDQLDYRVDAILCDLFMPEMDGWEFLNEYTKLDTKNRDHIIVMLTSSINPSDMSKAEELAPVSDYRSKPLSVEILKALIVKYLN